MSPRIVTPQRHAEPPEAEHPIPTRGTKDTTPAAPQPPSTRTARRQHFAWSIQVLDTETPKTLLCVITRQPEASSRVFLVEPVSNVADAAHARSAR